VLWLCLVRFLKNAPLVAACALVGACPVVAWAPAGAQDGRPRLLDVDQVRIGMKGYGLSVFRGTEPERFDVEVVGVLHNFRPQQDLILIKTLHERLTVAHTVAGMSGSPVFLDGRLVGAYAYGWQFGAEPIVGVTPIKNMLQDMARPVPPELLRPLPLGPRRPPSASAGGQAFVGPAGGYDLRGHAKQVADRAMAGRQAPSGTALAPALTPVSLGGLSDKSARFATELLAPLGFEALQAGGGTGKTDLAAPARYVDGGAIGVQFIRGDISSMGLGTVTRVEGDKLVAFGHPMQQGGVSALPTAVARVHWILASQQRSFKIGEAVRPLGTLVNDLSSSIVVDQKVQAPTFPLTVNVEGVPGAPKKRWQMEVTHDRFLSPSYVAVAMGNAVETTLSERRDTTWRSKTRIVVKNYGPVEVEDFGVAIGGTPGADELVRARAVRAVGQVLNNPWEFAQIESVDMTMSVEFGRHLYAVRGATLLEETPEPGRPARVRLTLSQFEGPDEVRVLEVPLPKSLAGRDVDIELVPGWSEQPDLPSPNSFAELLANLPRSTYAPDVLLATYRLPEQGVMFRGQVAQRLPPSALDALRPQHDSIAPEAINTTVRVPFPLGRFVEGKDRVRVSIRNVVR
jgi:SpoIVB peptidase S55